MLGKLGAAAAVAEPVEDFVSSNSGANDKPKAWSMLRAKRSAMSTSDDEVPSAGKGAGRASGELHINTVVAIANRR